MPQCTTGRVFVLKFKGSIRKLFFWSQEAKADKDDEYVSKINEYLNNPPTRSSNNGGSGSGQNILDINTETDIRSLLTGSDPNAQHLINLLGNVRGLSNPNQLASLLSGISARGAPSGGNSMSYSRAQRSYEQDEAVRSGNVSTSTSSEAGRTTVSTTTAPTSTGSIAGAAAGGSGSNSGVLLEQLQNVIQNYQRNQDETNQQPDVDLASGLNYDVLKPLLEDPAFMARISEHLPNTQETPAPPLAQQFTSTVQSPQFQQALSLFSVGLQSGQLGPLMQQFGLPDECVAAASAGNMEAFLKALQNHQKSGNKTSDASSTGEKKKDDHEDMALD